MSRKVFLSAVKLARESAPYLAESLNLYPHIIDELQIDSPDKIIDKLVGSLADIPASLTEEMTILRQFKRQVHLVIALADIAKVWTWVEVTEALTQLADVCMRRVLYASAVSAGLSPELENPVPGLFILAVGKYGARELNYSSDIDFNVFYDPELIVLPNMARAERTLIKLTQSLIRAFEKVTANGYIFRTDLRLRPDPRSNAIVVSTRTAERYYESLGQNWERAAMIKARVCGGDKAVGQAFINDVLVPFIWRRNLDYAAIEDIHSIKRQMQSVKGLETLSVTGHNLKLGIGGIREIEFFAQVQQLILGGRQPDIRSPRTVDALSALARGGYVVPEVATRLSDYYGTLRDLEHCAQMRRDAQTHIIPEDSADRLAIALLAGFKDLEAFDKRLREILIDVHTSYTALFPEFETLSAETGNLVFTGVEPDPATLVTLREYGFEQPEIVWVTLAAWLGGRIPATRSMRARELLTALAPTLLSICAETGQAGMAFDTFGSFFTDLKAGVNHLTLFKRHPDRLAKIIDLMLTSPKVRQKITEQTHILDVMSEPDYLDLTDQDISERFEKYINQPFDFEDTLDHVRRDVREEHFRVCASTLSQITHVNQTPVRFSNIADAAIRAILPVAVKEVSKSHALQGDYAVLGLGKLGGRELSLSSDLDLMVIYNPAADEDPRHYARLTQRLVSGLSVSTAEGGLFEVDMALRPSGRAGPVAVTQEGFQRYYAEAAWTWEFMALTKSRVIAASSEHYAQNLARCVSRILCMSRPDLNVVEDALDMRRRTAREKPPKSNWDLKEARGGLRDIEYVAQTLCLNGSDQISEMIGTSTANQIETAHACELIEGRCKDGLLSALAFYADVMNLHAMMSTAPLATLTERGAMRLARHLQVVNVTALEATRDQHIAMVQDCASAILGDIYAAG